MYTPVHFRPESIEAVQAFVKENSFAILVSYQDGKPIASHIPLLLVEREDKQVLWGHISKANPMWENIEGQEEVLAIFSEPHTYISSSWYNHVNVPTWNYIAVHIYGRVKIIDGEMLHQSIFDLVEKYEAGNEKRFHLSDLTEKDLKRQMHGIVGLELAVERVEASFKLSQNRKPEDFENIIRALHKRGDAQSEQIAAEMAKLKKGK